MLAQLRFPAEASRGRRYREAPHPYRSIYQRDRDRVIHARAFRRLEHKTQVFTTPYSDHFRNRLTHTIEVAQVSRTVAGALGLNEDLVEALALAHDLGHPPFGHAGEHILDLKMREYGEGFDHNLHALRIVEQFEQRYAAFPGLNLTFEVREGIIKHSRDYDPAQASELGEYLLDQRPLLEAQLIDLADEVTYSAADLDDAVEAKLLPVEAVCRAVEMFHAVVQKAKATYPHASERQIFNEALRSVLNQMVSGLIAGTVEAARKAGVRTHDDVRRHPSRLAKLTEETAAASRQLHDLLTDEVYESASLAAERQDTGQRVSELFDYFIRQPESLPPTYRERTGAEPLHRVVCDYIAGMTDKFLLRRHGSLVGRPSTS
jgi:dGTPase